jgi:hypothetical protein
MESLLKESLAHARIGTMIVDRKTEHEDLVKMYKEAIHFIEMTEALTYDQATAIRIRSFLQQQGIWP